jgi:hypothetical protein
MTKQVLMALTIALLQMPNAVARQPDSQAYVERTDIPLQCEENLIRLERLAFVTMEKVLSEKTTLIIVARLGDGERSRELIRRRLYNVREKLKERGVSEESMVVAQGERVRGYGRVEFYISGKKAESLLVSRNNDICVECCGDDERYYPDKRSTLGSRKKRQS